MRLLVFAKMFWPEGGGAELATYLIVKDILSKHFETTIVSGTRNPSSDAFRRCRYLYWPLLRQRFKPLEWLLLLSSTSTLRRLIEVHDVVYIPSHTLLPLAIAVKTLNPRIKVILHLHNYQPISYTSVVMAYGRRGLPIDVIVERFERNSLPRAVLTGLLSKTNVISMLSLYYADKIICVSKRQMELIAKAVPGIRDRLVVVYNPPPPIPDLPKSLCEKPTLLYIGGESYVKGFHVLLAALPRLLRLQVEVLIAGGLSDKQAMILKRISRAKTLTLRILGRLPHQKLLELYPKSWALIFPSVCEEPMPYAVVESMMAKTVPIASAVGGVVEIVANSPAERFSFRPGDVNELIDRVEMLLSISREDLTVIGDKLRSHLLRIFNMREIRKSFLEILA